MRLYNNFKDKRDSKVNFINNIFANATIFQSEWSRKINYKLGLKKKKNEIVISNAPDSKIFNSEGKIKFSLKRKTKIIATSWSNNWNKGFKDYMWLDNNLDFNKYEMIFVGNLPDNFEFKNIKHVKPLNSFDLAEKLKNSDIFITSSKKDPCSNSLIEAIHCGLPAIALNDGGHPEIIKKGGILYNKIEDVPNLINKIKKNYYFYKKAISINSIDKIGHRYFSFIERILTK
jgi:glycosyltransferase involved in cell wall biosynthesis